MQKSHNIILPRRLAVPACVLLLWGLCTGFAYGATEVFTSSGTFVPPDGITEVYAVVQGGGGAGGQGGGDHSSGGGAGAYCAGTVAVSGSVSITVGAAGGTSSFGSDISASGGSNGANGGGFQTGGAGGTCTGGEITISGAAGQSAGADNQWCRAGSGGSSPFGGFGFAVNHGNQDGFGTTRNGLAATGYGSGGSGECGSGTAGAGAAGVVLLDLHEQITNLNQLFSTIGTVYNLNVGHLFVPRGLSCGWPD